MRAIRSLDDVRIVLQELMAWKDKLEFTSWDFHRKRITNASPAIDDHDYVIKGQLSELVGSPPPTEVSSKGYYTIEFSNSGAIVVGNKVSGPYCVPRFGEGQIIEGYFAAEFNPSTTSSAEFTLNGSSINATPITLTGIGVSVFTDFTSSNISLKYLDLVNINILSGSAERVSLSLRVKRI